MSESAIFARAYVFYFAIKFVGYSLAAVYLNRVFAEKARSVLLVGVVRALIGSVIGMAVVLFVSVGPTLPHGNLLPAYLIGLSIVRALEWGILIRLFYWTPSALRRLPRAVPLLIVWSFILDIPASLGLFGAFRALIC